MVRPPRIELGPRVPETLVISLSLRAPGSFLSVVPVRVNHLDFTDDLEYLVLVQRVGAEGFTPPSPRGNRSCR